MRTRFTRSSIAVVGVAVLAVGVAACGSSSSGGTPKAGGTTAAQTVASGGTATYALDENLVGFNINTSAANEFVLQEILDIVTPTVYITTPQLTEVLNTDLVTSATQTSSSPQTVVYKINPKAQWSDGTPIDADDFIYNWQALSGSSKYKDVGGKPYDDAGTTGYNQIKSVVGSAPTTGSCDPGTAADRNKGMCPNGKTVTITFATPFADWQSLYGDMMPAHVARKIGWNTGFNKGKNVVGAASGFSGSWYMIKSYTPNQSVVLERNPTYWGNQGKLDTIVFRILSSDESEPPALQNKEVSFINPATLNTALVQQTAKIAGVTAKVIPGLEFEHFDFNQANAYLAKTAVRQAIAYGTDRNQIIQRTIGAIDPNITPLGNRMYVNTQPQYVNNGAAYDTVNDAKAKQLLTSAGMKMGGDGYFHPTSGPLKGKDLSFTIMSTTGNTVRQQTEELFQTQMKSIGVKIAIHNQDADTFFGTTLPQGEYDIGEFAWVATPFVSSNQSIYCSYTKGANCGQNWVHYANPQVDSMMAAGAAATDTQTEVNDFNQADKQLWTDMVTLPLYQKPQYFAWDSKLLNVQPNPSNAGGPWNAQAWGFAAAQ